MSYSNVKSLSPFIASKKNNHIDIKLLNNKNFYNWLNKQNDSIKNAVLEEGFIAKSGQIFLIKDKHNKTTSIIAGISDKPLISDGSKIYDEIKNKFSNDILKETSFSLDTQMGNLHIGWGLSAYKFSHYKNNNSDDINPLLFVSNKNNKKRIKTFVEAIYIVRDLINTPANDMGPEELETAMLNIANHHKITVKSIKGDELIKQNFPMIYEVGKASPRKPRLLELSWGNKNNPKITIIGKGVCFDTGGLDIKPSQFMLNMKKDMGGAAHALGLAHMIMSLKVPIYLRVIIPAVENSVSGNSYRPCDIVNSRKGISVEIGNTDAEGRLILADAITYACEDNPDIIIDFATLTGAARIALGYDLPALFSNNDEIAQKIQKISTQPDIDDPVWRLPLWQGYKKDLDSQIADINSTGTGKAGAINAALFLEEFITEGISWVHLDIYAWEQNGKTGRPKGGADNAMRAIFAFLENYIHNNNPKN